MSSEPYTPEEAEFIDTYVSAMSGGCTPIEDPERTTEARRGINKVKADALREAAEATRSEAPDEPHAGASLRSHADWLDGRADRIEGAIK